MTPGKKGSQLSVWPLDNVWIYRGFLSHCKSASNVTTWVFFKGQTVQINVHLLPATSRNHLAFQKLNVLECQKTRTQKMWHFYIESVIFLFVLSPQTLLSTRLSNHFSKFFTTQPRSWVVCCQIVHNSWRWKCHSVVDSPSSNVFGIPPMFISRCYCICHVSDNQAQILLNCSQL